MKYCQITKQHLATPCRHHYCNAPDISLEGKSYKKIDHDLIFDVKAINEEEFTVEGVFSSAVEDLQGEIVDQTGWDLTQFLKNPVVLWSHKDDELPVGQVIAIGTNEQGNLAGTIKFAVREYEFAATLFKLYAGRYCRAFSAGFLNNLFEIDQENEKIILKSNKLLEMSCVNIPANELALAKSKGIDITPIEKQITKDAQHVLETVQKEGRVLSKANREKVQAAVVALNELLKADSEKSADIKTQPNTKVETPAGQGGNKKSMRDFYKGKETVNKVLRNLLKVKADLK